jgi:DNA polymerase-3 subunit delta
MVLFFFGPNQFMVNKAVSALKDRYLKSSGGDLNMVSFDGESLQSQSFLAEIQAMPLLASSRLVIVRNIFKNKSKDTLDRMVDYIDKVPDSTVVIFADSEPDKRLRLFKKLSAVKGAKEYGLFDLGKIRQFIIEEVEARGAKIDSSAVNALSSYVGDDLWQISNEIDKLSSYCNGGTISVADVELLVEKNIFGNAFSMVESLFSADKKKMIIKMNEVLAMGEPPLKLLGLIIYQFRAIAQIKEASEKTTNNYEIAKIAAVAPFQVGKMLGVAKKIAWPDLSKKFSYLVKIDEDIKTGRIEAGEGLRDLILRF